MIINSASVLDPSGIISNKKSRAKAFALKHSILVLINEAPPKPSYSGNCFMFLHRNKEMLVKLKSVSILYITNPRSGSISKVKKETILNILFYKGFSLAF